MYKPTILFVSYGTGGAEALNPLYNKFKKEHYKTQNIAISDYAAPKLSNAIRVNEKDIIQYISEYSPDILINERASGHKIQNKITKYCKRNHISNISVLDFFGNYKERFTEIPDLIITPSKTINNEMLEAGFEKRYLAIGGNPSFDRLDDYVYKKKPNLQNPKVVFISQPFGGLEYDLFTKLYAKIQNNAPKTTFYAKLHPSEKESDWNNTIKNHPYSEIIKIDRSEDFLKHCLNYDLITSYNSTISIQTPMMGIPTINLAFDDLSLIDEFFIDGQLKNSPQYSDFEKDATKKCFNIIQDFILIGQTLKKEKSITEINAKAFQLKKQ